MHVRCLDNSLSSRRGTVGVVAGVAIAGDIWRLHSSLRKLCVSRVWQSRNDAYRSLFLANKRVAVVVLDGETEASRINVTVTPDEESTEDWFGQKVKDSVEYGLRVGSDYVATCSRSLE